MNRHRPSRAASPPARERAPWLVALLLAAATTVVYSNSFSLPFFFDDQSAIVENASIRSLADPGSALRGPYQSATAGRPAVNFSLALNYAAGGLTPFGYHALNLIIHVGAGLLLFGIIRRTLASTALVTSDRRLATGDWPAQRATAIAAACALLWMIHPLQSEVIDYVTERTESMMGLAVLGTLYLAIRGMHGRQSTRWYAAAVATCALGMTCKESMATAPLLVLLYDVAFVSTNVRAALGARSGLYAGLAACWLILTPLVSSGPRSHSAGFSSGVSPWVYLLNQPAIILRYLRLTVWPVGLVADYGLPAAIDWPRALVPAGALIVLAMATAVAWRRHRPLAFLGTWFFVTLAPTSSLLPIATEVGAERRMYLPLAAVVVFIVVAAHRGWQNRVLPERFSSGRRVRLPPSREASADRGSLAEAGRADRTSPAKAGHDVLLKTAQISALALVSVALGILTVRRNAEYANTLGLWETVIDRYPHGRARYNRGVLLQEAGRRTEAIEEFEKAAPDLPDAEYALGFELANEGRHAEAVPHFQRYTQARPDDLNVIRAYNLLGRSQLLMRSFEEAAASFRQVLRMQPGNVDALGGLGDALLGLDRGDEAIAAYQEYVRLAPGNAKAWTNLGLTLTRSGHHVEAIEAFTAAIALEPRTASLHMNLAGSLAEIDRLDEAIDQCRQAVGLEADPAARADIERLIALLISEKEKGRAVRPAPSQ